MARRVIDAENYFTGSWGEWSNVLDFYNVAIPLESDFFLQVLWPELQCEVHMLLHTCNGPNKLGCINVCFQLAYMNVRVPFIICCRRTVDS